MDQSDHPPPTDHDDIVHRFISCNVDEEHEVAPQEVVRDSEEVSMRYDTEDRVYPHTNDNIIICSHQLLMVFQPKRQTHNRYTNLKQSRYPPHSTHTPTMLMNLPT